VSVLGKSNMLILRIEASGQEINALANNVPYTKTSLCAWQCLAE